MLLFKPLTSWSKFKILNLLPTDLLRMNQYKDLFFTENISLLGSVRQYFLRKNLLKQFFANTLTFYLAQRNLSVLEL